MPRSGILPFKADGNRLSRPRVLGRYHASNPFLLRHHLQGKVRYKTCLSVFPNGVALVWPDWRSSSGAWGPVSDSYVLDVQVDVRAVL